MRPCQLPGTEDEQESMTSGNSGANITSVRPDSRSRPEIILQLLGNDFLVDIQMGDPVLVHFRRGRHRYAVARSIRLKDRAKEFRFVFLGIVGKSRYLSLWSASP